MQYPASRRSTKGLRCLTAYMLHDVLPKVVVLFGPCCLTIDYRRNRVEVCACARQRAAELDRFQDRGRAHHNESATVRFESTPCVRRGGKQKRKSFSVCGEKDPRVAASAAEVFAMSTARCERRTS